MSALREKNVLITGAASGIGRALASAALEAGARATLVDIDERALAEVAAGTDATRVAMSVADGDAWKTLVVPDDGWDFVALNAGVMSAPRDAPAEASDFMAITDDQYRRIVGVNLDGVAFGLRTTLPRLAETGAIVATASVAGLLGFAADPAYSMTKHGVIGLVRSVSAQLAMQGRPQRVCAICPGGVQTNIVPDFMAGTMDDAAMMDPAVIAAEIVDLWTSGENGEVRAKVLADRPAERIGEPRVGGFDMADL
ncbi:MAG: SDR family oxidoreductase [bacterium]|nr:SDR family oxidoreductase [bacterium]